MNKTINNFGKKLSRDTMKNIKGGRAQLCNKTADCFNAFCTPGKLSAGFCVQGICKLVSCL
jgi:hypothetical protein